jgi:hypothetical protein
MHAHANYMDRQVVLKTCGYNMHGFSANQSWYRRIHHSHDMAQCPIRGYCSRPCCERQVRGRRLMMEEGSSGLEEGDDGLANCVCTPLSVKKEGWRPWRACWPPVTPMHACILKAEKKINQTHTYRLVHGWVIKRQPLHGHSGSDWHTCVPMCCISFIVYIEWCTC